MKLQSYAEGRWFESTADGQVLRHAITGLPVAEITSEGLEFAAMLDHGRQVGGPALRTLTFHQRALRLKALARYLLDRKDAYYALSTATGATRTDGWIDIEGGIATLFAYSGKGRRELPNGHVYLDGEPEPLSRDDSFSGQHICLPLEGVAVHINAFNFPCWGMLEKLAPTLLAGMPAIVKPASQTAYLTELMFRDMIASGIFPSGALQLISGSVGDLMDHLDYQDALTFTGSAATGLKLRRHPSVVERSVRYTMEADSLNCSILGPDAEPGSETFELYVREMVREMSAKCGQKCTAIRRAIVPRQLAEAVGLTVSDRLGRLVIGDPMRDGVEMGALASLGQRQEVRDRIVELLAHCDRLCGGEPPPVVGADPEQGAFLSPTLLYCDSPLEVAAVHDIEAFGPVSTLMPYDSPDQAIELAKRGRGSLVGSVFTEDDDFARDMVLGAAAHHGRLLLANQHMAKASTGHGSPLPNLIHGGPGRAGGGEEMGGIRGVLQYMQRTALQGSPDTLSRVTDCWVRGARRTEGGPHPFRKCLEDLEIGDTLASPGRKVTLDDIEHFAHFTGDTFYAHMDEAAARANPFFDGRVAHGYFIVSAAAGLFVDPAPGPVLANYGLDRLRFMQPVYPGDTIRVLLTCKQKTARETEDYGEVRWDTTVLNQNDNVVAQYDVLTLVAKRSH